MKANAQNAFKPINEIGGQNGWYYANTLWKIRGWIDLLAGGVGIRRTRRNTQNFIIGDPLDWWRISHYIPDTLVRLGAEMKVPGKAWLQFEVIPDGDRCTIRQTAGMETDNFIGLIYWYVLFPLHALIFKGMLDAIGKKASRGQDLT